MKSWLKTNLLMTQMKAYSKPIINDGIGVKSGAAMNLFRHSCEKFLLSIYHVLH